MAKRPRFRYLVSVYYSEFIEADSEADAIDALAERVLGGELRVHQLEWTIHETHPTTDDSDS